MSWEPVLGGSGTNRSSTGLARRGNTLRWPNWRIRPLAWSMRAVMSPPPASRRWPRDFARSTLTQALSRQKPTGTLTPASRQPSAVAQLVEQWTVNPLVVGSSPTRGASSSPRRSRECPCIRWENGRFAVCRYFARIRVVGVPAPFPVAQTCPRGHLGDQAPTQVSRGRVDCRRPAPQYAPISAACPSLRSGAVRRGQRAVTVPLREFVDNPHVSRRGP